MLKEDLRLRPQAVQQHLERKVRATETCQLLGISERPLRYRCKNYREQDVERHQPEPRCPRHSPNRIHGNLVIRILQRRRRHSARGALRIHVLLRRRGVRVSWITVHRAPKRPGFMVWAVRKSKAFRRFRRRQVVSLGQADVHEFRIVGPPGKVYGHTILDDRSRWLVMARA